MRVVARRLVQLVVVVIVVTFFVVMSLVKKMSAEGAQRFTDVAIGHQLSLVQNDAATAQPAYVIGVMRHQKNRPTLFLKALNTVNALCLKTFVANGQHFVHH